MTWNPLTWLPFSRGGRQTLLALVFALCGPALTLCVLWILDTVRGFPGASGEARLDAYVKLAQPVGWSLIIIVVALACYISIRSFKAGPTGIEASGTGEGGDEVSATASVTVTKGEGQP
jgi:hypothetical protein